MGQLHTNTLPRLAVYGVLTLAITLLTACGASPATKGSQPTATVSRATETPQPPTSVIVMRFGGESNENHVAPFQRAVQDSASTQRLYRAVYAQPPYTYAAVGCLQDRFIGYELSFMRGETLVLEVLLSGGCPIIKIVGVPGCRVWTSDFTSQIADALGISAATLEPPDGLVNTASANGPFAPLGPTPSVSMPIRC